MPIFPNISFNTGFKLITPIEPIIADGGAYNLSKDEATRYPPDAASSRYP